jgi:alpha-ketoglutarate-dependent dioxygenase FTO
MFAHPWNTLEKDNGEAEKQNGDNVVVAEAKKTIWNLNESLTKRTVHHLDDLNEKRQTRGAPLTRGRAKYDVTLINRMENSPDLKIEPTTGEGKCSVSWHADSSLENFSSIAVYHSILSDTHTKQRAKLNEDHTTDQMSTRWSVALRVAHNSEGPGASRRGAAIDTSVVADTPPIAVSMPSGSAYYLLDDFNHHHQHAVLIKHEDGEDNTTGVRFASTHRLLREGHNINFIIERCRVACSQFHKKGPKIWRSEQLLLTEIESEWIRQFYVQGEGHKRLLWQVSLISKTGMLFSNHDQSHIRVIGFIA